MCKTGVILLAGGRGMRMMMTTPKQFLDLDGKPVALHSFEIFFEMPQIDEIVVVCPESYQLLFQNYINKTGGRDKIVRFAEPGHRRQDSVFSGLQALSADMELVCVHDAARPFIDPVLVCKVMAAAQHFGAAALGIPLKFTVKECDQQGIVKSTPDRSKLREIQTPQVVKKTILQQGFQYAHAEGFTVTDDVQLAELVGCQVKIIEGSEKNLKITLPCDLLLAQQLCMKSYVV